MFNKKEYRKQYYLKNKKKILKQCKKYYKKNHKNYLLEHSKYRLNHKKYFKEYNAQYYLKNRPNMISQSKNYYKQNKEQITEYKRKYYQIHKFHLNKKNQEWRKKHLNQYRRVRKRWEKLNRAKLTQKTIKKLQTDVNFRLRCYLSRNVRRALKNQSCRKNTKTMQLLNCSILDLKQYLKNKFTKGMSWKNYGKWHIDHIKPCSLFDLSDTLEQKKCFHYTNLQPLWAKDNFKKGAKYEEKSRR
ncbi:hypothetical protein LCGC14_1479420 [marine sediment metagenome]|uniref:Uncharacterized protein n=1 Tax=marine sediment metagenome TaxID=412755 RepID=A0A0F9MBP4_9ZZZZ